MSVHAHLDALNDKHHAISKQIKEAYRHHASDESVRELKKERLHIEEEMDRFYSMVAAPKRMVS